MKKLLVLGVGNILMMDEGIGVHAIYELLKQNWDEKIYQEIDLIDGGTFTQDIFYLFVEYEKILVLDIVKGGQKPGTIYRLTESDLRQNQKQTLSLHDIDLLDSLSMAKMAGKNPELHVLGIEPETINWSMELTPTLAKLFPNYVELARQEIIKLLDPEYEKATHII
ncbi:MAG: HyaD/HybD family hydrogenase maturation endopeptidase [Desulfamplus sp.]|nr:HyaD/HybD family hydrogenase maturation endopeptidase [Desulfamplus sp.]